MYRFMLMQYSTRLLCLIQAVGSDIFSNALAIYFVGVDVLSARLTTRESDIVDWKCR